MQSLHCVIIIIITIYENCIALNQHRAIVALNLIQVLFNVRFNRMCVPWETNQLLPTFSCKHHAVQLQECSFICTFVCNCLMLFHTSVKFDYSIWYSRRGLHYELFSGCICTWRVFSSSHLLSICISGSKRLTHFFPCQCSGKPLTEQGWVSSPWLHCWKREPVLVNQHQLHNIIIFSRVSAWILAEPQCILLIMGQTTTLNLILVGYLIPVIWCFPFGPVLDMDVTPRTTVRVNGKAL